MCFSIVSNLGRDRICLAEQHKKSVDIDNWQLLTLKDRKASYWDIQGTLGEKKIYEYFKDVSLLCLQRKNSLNILNTHLKQMQSNWPEGAAFQQLTHLPEV